MLSGKIPFVSACVFVLALLAVPAMAQDEELSDLFKQGTEAFYKGQYDEALQIFQAILAENPSNELAFQFWEEAGHKVFLDMLIKEGDYETVARRFIDLARVGRKEKQEDQGRIAELASQVVSGDHRQRREALLELEANHGEYAVPALYPELGNDEVEARVNAVTALFRMGQEVALPLIQVLAADDENIQRNTAVILGKIKDERSVPALKKLYVEASNPTIKDAAAEAILDITGKAADDLTTPSVLYGKMAEMYLAGDDTVCKPFLPSRVVWQWRDGELVSMPVLPNLRDLELAEDACYQALECDSGNYRAMALLTAVYAAQLAEITAMGSGEDDEDELAGFARESISKADTVLALCGPDRLADALTMTLDMDLNLAALEIIKVMETSGAFTRASFDKAYASGDKMVRYAAAFAAIKTGMVDQEIVWLATRALNERSVGLVLLVDDNTETRNTLLSGLNGSGYFAVGAPSGALGLSRAKAFPPKDLVIVRSNLKDMTIDSLVYEMATGPSAGSPVLLLVPQVDMDSVKELWEGKVAGIMSENEVSGDAYLGVVQSTIGDMNEARTKAEALSVRAAQALATLNGNVLEDVVEDLIQALDRPDEVRIPVLEALAKTGDRAALEGITQVFVDSSASAEARVAAAKALGSIFATGQAVPDGEVLTALSEAVSGDDANLRLAAAEAIGKAVDLESGQIKEILISNRIQ